MLNSDDWYEASAVEEVLEGFERNPDADLVSAAVRFVSGEGRLIKVSYPKSHWVLPLLMPLPHPGVFVRRSVFDRVGMYDERYRISADYDFVWRCYRERVNVLKLRSAVVTMELGGLANSSRGLARRETREIACRHSRDKVTPWVAWLLRVLTGR